MRRDEEIIIVMGLDGRHLYVRTPVALRLVRPFDAKCEFN
jgi:hypothetical protein